MPDFIFDTSKGVYRFAKSRRIVPQKRIDAAVAKVADNATANLKKLASAFSQGQISLPTWYLESTDQIRAAHRAVSMIAAGGKTRMAQREWGQVGGRLRSELSYFDAFSNQLGDMELGAAFEARAASYGQAVYATHAQALGKRHEKDGTAATESNELDAGAAHCDGCLEAEAAGEVPIGTLTPIGSRECGSRCRCRLVYST